jgi:hypothetical protein
MASEDLFVYSFILDSFNAQLERYHLLYTYELPVTMTVTALINRIVTDLASSPYNYQVTTASSASLLLHESLPLQLLEFVNRGVRRRVDNQIRLRRAAHGSRLLIDLAQDRAHYAISGPSIEGNHFVVHFGTFSL